MSDSANIAQIAPYRRLVFLTWFLTLDLIMFGAFVRLTDSGLGCPDWPGCYGNLSPIGASAHIEEAQAAMPGYAAITLDVAPEDAVKLVAARQAGTLTAMLRSPYDDQPSRKAARGDLAQLLGLSANTPAPKRRPVVLYGNRAVRNPPALQAPPVAPQWQGVFDLPRAASLVRAVPPDVSDADAAWLRDGATPDDSTMDVLQIGDGGDPRLPH